jgi:2'-5' RNA ligase
MRLFVAIDLDDAARRAMAEEQRRIGDAMGVDRSVRWVLPERMHLTLAFLASVSDQKLPALTDVLAAPLDAAPFLMALGGLGVFPSRGAPRTLWVGLRAGSAGAVDVQREVAERIGRTGLRLEARAFHPHLTLARWRTSRTSDRDRAFAGARDAELARVTVDHLTLYQSRLSSAGPAYTPLLRVSLAP